MSDFGTNSDETLVKYWNDGDGAISWLIALEDELIRRGYETRTAAGTPARCLKVGQ